MIKIIITIDRIEENYAVCEDENLNFFDLPLNAFPCMVNEGDVFELDLIKRNDLKAIQEEKIKNLFDKLKNKGENNEN